MPHVTFLAGATSRSSVPETKRLGLKRTTGALSYFFARALGGKLAKEGVATDPLRLFETQYPRSDAESPIDSGRAAKPGALCIRQTGFDICRRLASDRTRRDRVRGRRRRRFALARSCSSHSALADAGASPSPSPAAPAPASADGGASTSPAPAPARPGVLVGRRRRFALARACAVSRAGWPPATVADAAGDDSVRVTNHRWVGQGLGDDRERGERSPGRRRSKPISCGTSARARPCLAATS